MREPDAMWDHVPVFIKEAGATWRVGDGRPWDASFRDYVIPTQEPKKPQLQGYGDMTRMDFPFFMRSRLTSIRNSRKQWNGISGN